MHFYGIWTIMLLCMIYFVIAIIYYYVSSVRLPDNTVTEGFISFESDQEKLAFCKTVGEAMKVCEKNKESKECSHFQQSIQSLTQSLNTLLEINNNNFREV